MITVHKPTESDYHKIRACMVLTKHKIWDSTTNKFVIPGKKTLKKIVENLINTILDLAESNPGLPAITASEYGFYVVYFDNSLIKTITVKWSII